MMSLEEIRDANVNLAVAREALSQANARLSDVLDTKKTFEQKAFTLFNGYLTVSLALFGVGGAIYKTDGLTHTVQSFWITALLVLLGVVLFVLALRGGKYGALGSNPSMWLNSGTIDGAENVALPHMIAYVAWHHESRIDTSIRQNNRKAHLINWGVWIGAAAPVLLIALLWLRR